MEKLVWFWQCIAQDIHNKYQNGDPSGWGPKQIETFIKKIERELGEILLEDDEKATICEFEDIDTWSFTISTTTFKRFFRYKKGGGHKRTQNCFAVFLGYNSAGHYMTSKENEIIEKQKSREEQTTTYSKYLTSPPPKPINFIGRSQELEAVHQILQEYPSVVLVNGVGGIGKTTLAQAYLYKYRKHYQYLVWITVNKNIQEAVLDSDLADSLGIEISDKQTVEKKVNRIWRKLASLEGEKKLLVFDNVNNVEDLMKYHFTLPDWDVLLTSRSKVENFKIYSVETLPQSSAKELFIKYYPLAKKQIGLLEQLLEVIGYHTLTIELLAKNLSESRRYNLSDLIGNLQEKGLLHPDETTTVSVPYIEGAYLYPHIISAMFDIRPLSSYTQWLLLQFSVLPSDYISYRDMSHFLQINSQTVKQFDNTLKELVEKGWVMDDGHIDIDKRRYRVHEVIQEVVRDKVKPTYKNCFSLVNFFNKQLHRRIDEGFREKVSYLLFTERLLYSLKECKDEHIIDLYARVGILNLDLGNYMKASELCLKAIEISENMSEIPLYSLASLYGYLASIYQVMGRFEESISFEEKCISILENNYPNKQEIIAIAYNNIALTYFYYSNFKQALIYQKKAIKIQEQKLTYNHIDLLHSYQNIAIIHMEIDNDKTALMYNGKSMEIFEQNDKKSDGLARIYTTRGSIFEKMGKYKTALDLSLKALKIQEKILNARNPSLAITYNNIGKAYHGLGKKDKTLVFLEKSLSIRKEYYGEKHPQTALAYDRYGCIFRDYGKLDIALQYHIKAIDIQRTTLQSKHYDLGKSYFNISHVYFDKKQWNLAEKYIDQAINIFEYNFPKGHSMIDKSYELKKLIQRGRNS